MLRLLPSLEELFAFAFATVLARQALWLVPGTAVPIALSVLVGVAVALVVRRSSASRPSPPSLFLLVVALPVLVLWAVRAPLPDVGYDVLNYHLMHGEKALLGPPFPPGDFYPYFFPFLNPAGDMVTALFRVALGYRLGTIVSPLTLIWAGQVLWRLLAPAVKDERWRAVAVLLAVASDGMLREASGYLVDLLALPVLLEATRMALERTEAERLRRRGATFGLLLGTAVALKLTNLVFAVPIALVAALRWLAPRDGRPKGRVIATAGLAAALAFAVPVAPHALLLVRKTGNPVFPYFNALFASPYFPVWNIKDGRWGPRSFAEALVWPVLSWLRPSRLSELEAASGRLVLGWLAALASLVAFRRDARLAACAAIVALCGVFWSLGTGYQRYGLFCELLGGLVLALVASKLASDATPSRPRRVLAATLLVAATAQSAWSVLAAARSDWSGRPMVFHDLRASAREATYLLHDRDLAAYLPAQWRSALASPPVWVDVAPKVNGLMTLLAPRAPMIGLQMEEFLEAKPNLALLDAALRANAGRPAYSLAFEEDAAAAESRLFRLGFPVLSRTPVSFPFFSDGRRLDLVFFEVGLPPPLAEGVSLSTPSPWGVAVSLRGSMDEPVEGQRVVGDLLVRGWAREEGEDLRVDVLVDGVEVGPIEFRRVPRPDVAAALPAMGDCRWAGYEAVVARPAGLSAGREVSVVFRSRDGRSRHYPGVKVRWEEAGAAGTERPSAS